VHDLEEIGKKESTFTRRKEKDKIEKSKEKERSQPKKSVIPNEELLTKERIEKLTNEVESLKLKLKRERLDSKDHARRWIAAKKEKFTHYPCNCG